ncbi:MAG: SdpI family protein, partial [Micrococcaceae bacterium]|nr:SdpI family protein [Micrococcaceae bacterium]
LPATRASDDAWEETHVVAGPWLMLAGLVPFLTGILILIPGASMPEWTVLGAYAAMVVFVIVGAVLGVRAANAVNSPS